METYEQYKADYDRVFAQHTLELVLNQDPFRAYMLRPAGGGHPNSVMVMFTPEGIVVMGDHAPTRTGIVASGYNLKWFSERKNPEYLAGKFDLPEGYNHALAIEFMRGRAQDTALTEMVRDEYSEWLEVFELGDAGEHEFYVKLQELNEEEWYLRARGYDPNVMAKLTAIQHRFAACMGDLAKEESKEVATNN